MSREPITYDISVGDGVLVLQRRGRHDPIVATILGSEPRPGGLRCYWLDRRVHVGHTADLNDDWHATGAISSVVTGPDLLPA